MDIDEKTLSFLCCVAKVNDEITSCRASEILGIKIVDFDRMVADWDNNRKHLDAVIKDFKCGNARITVIRGSLEITVNIDGEEFYSSMGVDSAVNVARDINPLDIVLFRTAQKNGYRYIGSTLNDDEKAETFHMITKDGKKVGMSYAEIVSLWGKYIDITEESKKIL